MTRISAAGDAQQEQPYPPQAGQAASPPANAGIQAVAAHQNKDVPGASRCSHYAGGFILKALLVLMQAGSRPRLASPSKFKQATTLKQATKLFASLHH